MLPMSHTFNVHSLVSVLPACLQHISHLATSRAFSHHCLEKDVHAVSGPFRHALLRHLTEWPHQVAVVQSQSGYHGFIHNCNGPIVHMVGAAVWMYSGMVGVWITLLQWGMQVNYIVLR